jgi:hypothetical protein
MPMSLLKQEAEDSMNNVSSAKEEISNLLLTLRRTVEIESEKPIHMPSWNTGETLLDMS